MGRCRGSRGCGGILSRMFLDGVVFFDLGGNSDWVRIRGQCVSEVGLGFLIFLVGDDFGG